jgi:hypothetical protein
MSDASPVFSLPTADLFKYYHLYPGLELSNHHTLNLDFISLSLLPIAFSFFSPIGLPTAMEDIRF